MLADACVTIALLPLHGALYDDRARLDWGLIVAVVVCVEFWIALAAFVLGP